MNQRNDTGAKRAVTGKGTKLPVAQSRKSVKSSYLIPSKSAAAAKTSLDNGKKPSSAVKDGAKPSAQVQEMIDRFRYAKPMPSEQREKQTFWWNDDASTEFSDAVEDDELNGNFITNLKDLDLKARELIDKSEFTLSEKLISSEGLGSTSTATLISNSQVSSAVEEEAVYKPDFVKYIETKNRLEAGAFKVNPNEDILQKWRLRRKLEESKSTVQQQQHQTNIDDLLSRRAQLLVHQTYYQQEQLAARAQETSPRTPVTARTIESEPSLISKSKSSIATMTLPQRTETAVQTSIENPNYMDDKPTKDDDVDELKLAKYVDNSRSRNRNINYKIEQQFPKHHHRSSKSPTFKSTSTSIFDKAASICSVQRSNASDLTKISSIYDNNRNSIDRLGSVDNDTNKQEDNIHNETDLVVYSSSNNKKNPEDLSQNQSRINSNLIFDSSYYESDELLNILFKKLFFYQSKLDDIESIIEAKQI